MTVHTIRDWLVLVFICLDILTSRHRDFLQLYWADDGNISIVVEECFEAYNPATHAAFFHTSIWNPVDNYVV